MCYEIKKNHQHNIQWQDWIRRYFGAKALRNMDKVFRANGAIWR